MKINKMKLRLVGHKNQLITEKKLLNLPVDETTLLELSVTIFDDPEPCMIHRSAIMKKMYVEIYDFLIELVEQKQSLVLWEDLPKHLQSYFIKDYAGQLHTIEIK